MSYPIYPRGREGVLLYLCDQLFNLVDRNQEVAVWDRDSDSFYHGFLSQDPVTSEFIVKSEEGPTITVYVEHIIYGPDAGNLIEVQNAI